MVRRSSSNDAPDGPVIRSRTLGLVLDDAGVELSAPERRGRRRIPFDEITLIRVGLEPLGGGHGGQMVMRWRHRCLLWIKGEKKALRMTAYPGDPDYEGFIIPAVERLLGHGVRVQQGVGYFTPLVLVVLLAAVLALFVPAFLAGDAGQRLAVALVGLGGIAVMGVILAWVTLTHLPRGIETSAPVARLVERGRRIAARRRHQRR